MAATCFCGHGEPVKGVRRRASNGIGAQIQTDLATFRGAIADGIVDGSDLEFQQMLSEGDALLEEMSAVVHGGDKGDGYKERVKAWTDRAHEPRKHVELALRDAGVSGKWFGSAGKRLYEGTRAPGVILKVRDTGTTVNNDPKVELTIRVDPPDGEPFELSKKMLVSRTNLPRPNEAVEVGYDPDDPSDFVWRLVPGGPAAAAPTPDRIEQLERLKALHESGALSDEEFEAEKRRVLDDG
jgi:hypothetical protein